MACLVQRSKSTYLQVAFPRTVEQVPPFLQYPSVHVEAAREKQVRSVEPKGRQNPDEK